MLTNVWWQNLVLRNGPARAGYQLVESKQTAVIDNSSAVVVASSSPEWALFSDIININGRTLLSGMTPVAIADIERVSPAWFREAGIKVCDRVLRRRSC